MLAAIISRFFARHGGVDGHQRAVVAKNTILALADYGILDAERRLTDFGRRLVDLVSDERALYEELARHILLNLRGLDFMAALRGMRRARQTITLETLARELRQRGLYVPRGSMDMSGLKGWLSKAGVVAERGYDINEERLAQILGIDSAKVESLASLTREHQAFLRSLAALAPQGFVSSRDVVKHALAVYGVELPEKSMSKFLDPIVEIGLVERKKTTTGRGAKADLVQLTGVAQAQVLDPLIKSLAAKGPSLGPLWSKPLDETLQEMQSPDSHVKGIALEALAVYLCRILGLSFVGWRVRGLDTAGAEVDVVAEAARFLYSRWQIQCKNTGAVSLHHVAKEVGVSVHLRSNVIVMVTTGRVTPEARHFAAETMAASHLQIVLLEGSDLRTAASDPGKLVDILVRESEHAMKVKELTQDA